MRKEPLVSARHVNKLNHCLILSLCLHSLFALGLLQYMTAAVSDPASPAPVSVRLTAPVLASITPYIDQRARLRRPIPPISRPLSVPQPTALLLTAATVTATHASQPTIAGASSSLPRRVPPNRRMPIKRLSAPTGKTLPAIPKDSKKHLHQTEISAARAAISPSHPAQTSSATASTGLLNSNRPRQFAAVQTTGDQLPEFIYQPKPHYPLVARRRGWQGTVLLNIEMRSDGTVGTIKVAASSGYPPLDAAARKAVSKWRHRPLQRNGIPITRQANLPIHFRLD